VSSNILRLIPVIPTYLPETEAQERARRYLARVLPSSTLVEVSASAHPRFVDPGGNLESIQCPACRREVSTEWWAEATDRAHAGRFADLSVVVPCCGAHTSLNDLVYVWPAGFARFVLEATDPGITALSKGHVRALETELGCPLREIWARY